MKKTGIEWTLPADAWLRLAIQKNSAATEVKILDARDIGCHQNGPVKAAVPNTGEGR